MGLQPQPMCCGQISLSALISSTQGWLTQLKYLCVSIHGYIYIYIFKFIPAWRYNRKFIISGEFPYREGVNLVLR